MEDSFPTCSSSAILTDRRLQYERLPFFLIQQIGESLNLDDRLNFMASSPHIFKALKPTFRRFNYIQICDEYRENFIRSDAGEELMFSSQHLVQVLQVCINLQQVLITVKPPLGGNPETNCPVFESALYQFCRIAPSSLLNSLRSISLNFDLTVGSFSQLSISCPVEDLYFAVLHLSKCSFNTFIQIGFCASTYTVEDGPVNRSYLNAMYQICARMRKLGCKAMVDLGANDGYVDLSVEIGKVEYNFAYFYYNPKICEPHDQEDLDMDEQDSDFMEFNEMVLAETFQQQPHLYEKPLEENKFECDLKDLYKFL